MKNLQLDISFLNSLDDIFYNYEQQDSLQNPSVVSINKTFAKNLNLLATTLDDESFITFVNTKFSQKNSKAYASSYSGHQFGYFVPNLGDGRALNLGKINNYYLQLKGSGTTAYSRDGDGRAILSSSIREYLLSEAMYGLGIPTTRALGIISSDTKVLRMYEQKTAAIVLRASTSWTRFGSFEFAYIQKDKKISCLKQLADITIQQSYPELQNLEDKYNRFYCQVVDRTIELLALWQSVGFCHGVMNTDNMSIEGLTIDYGPYAMMEEFDKGFVCNLSDHEGRYSFENQPFIAQWNLSVLAKVLSPIADHKSMESYNDSFIGKFKKRYFSIMKEKLGLYNNIDDRKLILQLFNAMQDNKIDYTSFFYELSSGSYDSLSGKSINRWIQDYKQRLEAEELDKSQRFEKMLKINPKYILRNYMLQDAIDAAENGDFTLVNDFLKIAHNPYGDFPEYQHYTKPKPGSESIKCSCSS